MTEEYEYIFKVNTESLVEELSKKYKNFSVINTGDSITIILPLNLHEADKRTLEETVRKLFPHFRFVGKAKRKKEG